MFYNCQSLVICLSLQNISLGCINQSEMMSIIKSYRLFQRSHYVPSVYFPKDIAKLPGYHNIPVFKYSNRFVIFTILLFFPLDYFVLIYLLVRTFIFPCNKLLMIFVCLSLDIN